jgi:nucleotide-binding universal stress UspA family protein
MGALSQNLFTMIVAMAIATTMAMPPMLRWALARVPMTKAEKARLEREEFEAKGFVANLERLLLTVDESPNGKFASRLAGLLAGTHGLPITLLPLSKGDTEAGDHAEKTVKDAAADARRSQADEDEPARVDVTRRRHRAASEDAVAKEAERGYDLLFVGIEHTRAKNGGFHPDVTRIAAAFAGPLALVAGNGIHLQQPERSPLRILMPLNGTEVSRRAAEVAIALARASGNPVTAIYVANPGGSPRKRRKFRASREEQAIIKDVVELADRYDVPTRTAIHSEVAPDEAILIEAKKHDLIVMGVGRRPGDKLFFGDTAAAVFEQSPASILFVAS